MQFECNVYQTLYNYMCKHIFDYFLLHELNIIVNKDYKTK